MQEETVIGSSGKPEVVTGSFEIHIFVEPLDPPPEAVEAFHLACRGAPEPMKALLLQLDYVGRGFVGVLQSSRYVRGGVAEAREAARVDAARLRAAGFSVIREKVEAVATNEGVPQDARDATDSPADRYFEFHVLIDGQKGPLSPEDMVALRALAAAFSAKLRSPVPLSYNALKPAQRFLNVRARGVGLDAALGMVHELEQAALALGQVVVKKTIAEYICFDSNRAVDNGWLEPLLSVHPEDLMNTIGLGQSARSKLAWTFGGIAAVARLCLLNNDESGSMQGQLGQNALAFDKVSALFSERFDAVIVHGFGSDSAYTIYATASLAKVFRGMLEGSRLTAVVHEVASDRETVTATRKFLKGRETHGSTNPGSHPRFLDLFATALNAYPGTLELVVANTSDGGFDGGSPQKAIQDQMLRITARCRCKVVANVLVGSSGSPAALHFFTGDADAFDTRLLFATQRGSLPEGVLFLENFDPAKVGIEGAVGEERLTLQPSTPFWQFSRESDTLLAYWPEGAAPTKEITLRRHQPQPGNREILLTATVKLTPAPVRIDHEAREMFALIARCFSDNPYLRDESRASLNGMLAGLEPLLATRAEVIQTLTAGEAERAITEGLRRQLDENFVQMQVTRAGSFPLREMSARINTLNNARRLLKKALRTAQEGLEQQMLEREIAFLRDHPDHWVTWLQPAIDEIQQQLSATQEDVGDAMAHLSTRIRSKKSREDGQTRSIDRHVEALLAKSRSRNDRAERAQNPLDSVPFEQPGAWLTGRCPITGAPITEGLVGIPFVADRRDITSGNVAAGGQNVDRMPIERDALLSLRAVRELMWSMNGQMATPFCTARGVYNAAIPVLLGPATPALVRDLEKGIGWLCTGTSAFESAMAEALPAALGSILGRLDAGDADADLPGLLSRDQQAHALLRTSALLDQFRSFPYVTGTSVLDESQGRMPLPEVWAIGLVDTAEFACMQSSGCLSSVLAKAVVATESDPVLVARGMFSWACRNIARAILGDSATDGRGGVEGIRRFAALLRLDVELAGYEPVATFVPPPVVLTPPGTEDSDRLTPGALATLLGQELLPLWDNSRPLTRSTFVETLNAWISALPPEHLMFVVDRLGGVFARLDELEGAAVASPREPATEFATSPRAPVVSDQSVKMTGETHEHFGILALEAVAPVRAWTATPGLADEGLGVRRVLKAGETRWIAPKDARLGAGQLNASARRFLNEHSAMRPLRALLRLRAADCLGLAKLKSLRASAEAKPFPRVDDVVGALEGIVGGTDEVILLAYRAFAFVVAEANGYADKRWAESRLRTAALAEVEKILGLAPISADLPAPVHHGRAPWVIPSSDEPLWPRMIGKGFLPKSRAIDRSGATLGQPYRCTTEEVLLRDDLLCQKSSSTLISKLEAEGILILPGLHRQARGVLGEYPRDLREATEAERRTILAEALLPKMAGKVGGDPEHPLFFVHCAIVLRDMIELGEDTRTFRAEEPREFIHEEAERIRSLAQKA